MSIKTNKNSANPVPAAVRRLRSRARQFGGYGIKNNKFGYNLLEMRLFKRLNTPKKIQDFLETLKINFEKGGDTCMSPRLVIKTKRAHCMEGAILAAAALEFNGAKPFVVDLRAMDHDFDHVVAVFKQFGCFGAISKTNHAVLRFREPVYKTIRELVMSFFHEYFDDNGIKTLREYSKPFDLNNFNRLNWRTSEESLMPIADYLDEIKHYPILSKTQIRQLRLADEIEIKAGKLVEWKNNEL
jgi:hypothetical protein